MRTLLIFVTAAVGIGLAILPPGAEAQEPVLLRLGGPVGRPVRCRIVVNTFTQGIPIGVSVRDSTLPSSRLTLDLTMTLNAISGDTLSFTAAIDSAHGDSPATPELSPMLSAALAGAPGRTTFRIDSRGAFISEDSASGAAGASTRRIPGAAGPRKGGFVLPIRAVRVGDIWADSSPQRRPVSTPEIASRRLYRLERIEPGGDSGIAVISMAATLTVQLPLGMTDVPSVGIARFDIAAHRVTAFAITEVFSAPTPGGQITTRSETVLTEPGNTPLVAPRLDVSSPTAPSSRPPDGP